MARNSHSDVESTTTKVFNFALVIVNSIVIESLKFTMFASFKKVVPFVL